MDFGWNRIAELFYEQKERKEKKKIKVREREREREPLRVTS